MALFQLFPACFTSATLPRSHTVTGRLLKMGQQRMKAVLRPSTARTVAVKQRQWSLAFIATAALFTCATLGITYIPWNKVVGVGGNRYDWAATLAMFVGYSLAPLICLLQHFYPNLLRLHQVIETATQKVRFRRQHSAHIRLDRLVKHQNSFTIFIRGLTNSSIPLLVTSDHTIAEIERELQRRLLIPKSSSDTIYFYSSTRRLPLSLDSTVQDICLGPLSTIHTWFPLLGGNPSDARPGAKRGREEVDTNNIVEGSRTRKVTKKVQEQQATGSGPPHRAHQAGNGARQVSRKDSGISSVSGDTIQSSSAPTAEGLTSPGSRNGQANEDDIEYVESDLEPTTTQNDRDGQLPGDDDEPIATRENNGDEQVDDDAADQSDIELPEAKGKGRERAPVKLFYTEIDKNNPDDRRWCKVCQKQARKSPKIPAMSYGQTTGNSTLLAHLKDKHPKSYEKCQDMAQGGDGRLGKKFQQTLDKHLRDRDPEQQYSSSGLALACLKLIAACDLVRVDTF
ncbi:hypothetical protein BD410DRAFT_842379 [Rickenella mellea]|uniref:Ubiquitin-like domain-containing protein n=1 Tax=Rickenella mellea TaxID=50990 RepID=A0A4Y7PWI0_9AGAM|nr:hypothetical protein BD410DRAFT_842379 [Rickenella mellea]